MEDNEIIELYFARDERAIEHTKRKYGPLCTSVALRVLGDGRDAEECVNDTYLGAWNAIPPHKPEVLSSFLARITRNLSLKRWRARSAIKRGAGEVAMSLDELEECVAAQAGDVTERLEAEDLAHLLDTFLAGLPSEQRRMFMCRYWHFDSVRDIAQRFGFSESKVKMSLKRTRDSLAVFLASEGVTV